MKDFLKRLTSRKFLAMVASVYLLYVNGQFNEMVAVVVAYLASEGAGDVVQRYQSEKAKFATEQYAALGDPYDDVDKSQIVAGGHTTDEV